MELFGFNKISKTLLTNFNQNKLYHCLLFSGNKGIGKFSFAFEFATQIILSSSAQKTLDLAKIKSGSHPNLLIFKKEEKKQSISAELIKKEISNFVNLSSAISKHRIIIIDSVDDLNQYSNNALLKIIEEPPPNVFLFLINHNQAKLLDTIKSRCQLIKINKISYQEFSVALKNNIPKINQEEIDLLSLICDFSVGLAIQAYKQNCLDLYKEIETLILENNQKGIFDLSKKIASNEDLWIIFEKLIILYFYNKIHPKFSDNLILQQKISKNFLIFDKINNLFLSTHKLNLDKMQLMANVFNIIKNS